jgi:uncharacterized protein (TIGR02466 family)
MLEREFNRSYYFSTPIYTIEKPEWLSQLDNASNKYIKASKKHHEKDLNLRSIKYKKNIGDLGFSFNSTSLINDPDFKVLQDYVGVHSWQMLNEMGFDMLAYELYWTEFWVQQFGRNGGGHHEGHIHYDNHVSGFYFLRCSENTSYPVFHDPRYAKHMNNMPLHKDAKATSPAADKVMYKPKPGTLIFFPAYVEHQYVVDDGIDDFRFIHFNLQAIRKSIANTIRFLDKNKK